MKTRILLLCIASLTLSIAVHAQDLDGAEMKEFAQAMGAMMGAGSNAVPVADFREMKALLPAALTDMKRTKASGEKTGAMGMIVSYAEATYESDSGGTIEIKITDNSGLGALMALSQAGWTTMEIDQETETGYERTTTIGGAKALEKYDSADRSGEIQIMVDNRFMVQATGSGVEAAAVKAAVEAIDLKKLAGIKPKAATTPP